MKDLFLTLEIIQHLKIICTALDKIKSINEKEVDDLCLTLEIIKCDLLTKSKRCKE